MIRYSVVVPIYNMELYLEECLESIFVQNRDDIEVILVNDGSKDRSLEICNKFKEKYTNVIVIDKENSGTTETILKGLENVSGKYVCFVDADDKITNDFFQILDEYVENDYDIVIYDFKRLFKKHLEDFKVNKINYGEITQKELENLQCSYFSNFNKYSLYRWDKIIKADIVKKSIEEIEAKTIYFEDHVISFLNLLNAKRICYIDKKLYFYRMRKNSVSHRVNEKIFDDLIIIENEMNRIAINKKYDVSQIHELYLYFLYQYARNSLRSKNVHNLKTVKWKDISSIKSKNKKIVVLLYKLKMKKIYNILLKLKRRKENTCLEEYFD